MTQTTVTASVAELAAELRAASHSMRAIPPIRDRLPEPSVQCAYQLQELNTTLALQNGRRLVGRKIGITSRSIQAQLGVNSPDFGMLFADMELTNGAEIPPGRLIAPKVEAEMAFVLGRPIEQGDATIHEILESIEWVWPALEIVDSRIDKWDISILDTVADNASSGLYVLGSAARRAEEVDFRLAGMMLERCGVPESVGASAACLGSPLNAVQWLAHAMVKVGRPLNKGDVILSGALGSMVTARQGDHFRAIIDGLGDVSVQFGVE